MPADLSADDIRRLFTKLDAELTRRGKSATIYVVDGADIALTVDNSRSTTDIDAVYKSGADAIRQAAQAVTLKSLTKRPQDLADIWKLMRLTGIRTPQDLGRTIARYTGPRIFQNQGQPWMPFHIDPTFHDIFDNAPDDLRPPGYGVPKGRRTAQISGGNPTNSI